MGDQNGMRSILIGYDGSPASRGIGSLPQMLLGPVPQVALHEARCPVAVVPAPETGR